MYAHRRRSDAPARADPAGHGRRALALICPARARNRSTWRCFRRRAISSALDDEDARRPLDEAASRCASRCSREIEPLARTSRSAARCRPRSCSRPLPRSSRFSRQHAARAADALHRVRGRAAAGAARRGSAPAKRHPRITIERAGRHEVRALLALRALRSRPIRPGPACANGARTRSRSRFMAELTDAAAALDAAGGAASSWCCRSRSSCSIR